MHWSSVEVGGRSAQFESKISSFTSNDSSVSWTGPIEIVDIIAKRRRTCCARSGVAHQGCLTGLGRFVPSGFLDGYCTGGRSRPRTLSFGAVSSSTPPAPSWHRALVGGRIGEREQEFAPSPSLRSSNHPKTRKGSMTLGRTCPPKCQEGQLCVQRFENSPSPVIRISIAFRCILDQCRDQEIRCWRFCGLRRSSNVR